MIIYNVCILWILVRVYVCVWVYVCMSVWVYVCMSVCVCLCVYVILTCNLNRVVQKNGHFHYIICYVHISDKDKQMQWYQSIWCLTCPPFALMTLFYISSLSQILVVLFPDDAVMTWLLQMINIPNAHLTHTCYCRTPQTTGFKLRVVWGHFSGLMHKFASLSRWARPQG